MSTPTNSLPVIVAGGGIGGLAAALALVRFCLLRAGTVIALFGRAGSNAIARVMGILLAALAVQFMVDGAHDVLTGWNHH